MKLIVALAVMAMGLVLLRSMWRMLVDIPDTRQVWVPDVVDELLSKLIAASLMLGSGLLLVEMMRSAA